MSESERGEPRGPGRVRPSETTKTAEDRRQAARRRFLMGGAAALPMIVTLGQKEAFAASAGVCMSAGMAFADGFRKRDYMKYAEGKLPDSIYCRPENL